MPPAPLLLGCDIGSGSCKTVVLDDRGRVVAGASRDYPSHHPHPDWVEQDPEAWYRALCATTREVLASPEVERSAIEAACIVGATHTPVLLGDDGAPLRPAIHFWDRRSGEQVAQLKARWGDEVERRARNGLGVLWTWPQLLWVRQHEPEVWRRIALLLFPKDYVRHRLAPSPITDRVDAVGTLLYDPIAQRWIEPFVDDLGLHESALPDARPPLEIAARIGPEGSADSGLPEGLPLPAPPGRAERS
jgi:xylulokinase